METDQSIGCPIPGVTLTPLKRFVGPLGNVMHGLRSDDASFKGFGEAYFSTVNYQSIKPWRLHHKVTLNLMVPEGEVRFVLCDNRGEEAIYWEVTLSPDHYHRLTIAPGVWLAFQGVSSGTNLIMDLIDLPHDPEESVKKELEEIPYSW